MTRDSVRRTSDLVQVLFEDIYRKHLSRKKDAQEAISSKPLLRIADNPLGVDGKRYSDLCLLLAGRSATMVNMKVRRWGGGVLLLESVP
jgi:hypothetical protein